MEKTLKFSEVTENLVLLNCWATMVNLHSGHQGMNLPLKKSSPSFWPNSPSKYEIVQAPLLLQPPSIWWKFWLVLFPPVFTKSCFMKLIVGYREMIVFRQDLTTTGSSNKKILVFFHFTTKYRGSVLSGWTQQLILWHVSSQNKYENRIQLVTMR